MRICIRYAGAKEDAEQLVHDGFIKIFASLPQYQYLGSFEGWMKRIVVRLCIDHIRAQNAQKNEVEHNTVYNDYAHADERHYTDNSILQKIGVEELVILINRLPAKQRMVFNLHVFEDYSHKEIAPLLQISENHSYWLLHQARKQLKDALQHYNNKKTLKHEPE